VEAGLSMGSNRGDRLGHLRQAVKRLARLPGVRILARSALYETEPVDVPPGFEHLMFLNAVVIVEWPGAVRDLLRAAKALEKAAGRKPAVRNGPRPLDVDILYFGREIVAEPDLAVPHPRALERRFVLEPLAELRPGLVLPGCRTSVSGALKALPAEGVTIWRETWD
jgi:2-amino-4-hydroxy-6-hydroxymethyldihydropteridine diphosphokinase